MSKTTVAVLMGGPDAERSVSITSGTAIADALETTGKFEIQRICINRITQKEINVIDADVFFPALHGPFGEGGALQLLLERCGKPFVGSGSEASAVAMDKCKTKEIAISIDVPTPLWSTVESKEDINLPLPLVLKPNDDGSSIGIALCHTQTQLEKVCKNLLTGRKYMEEALVHGQEITVGIIDGSPLPIIEIIPPTDLDSYDFEAKYERDDTQYILNPQLPSNSCVEYALQIYEKLQLRDLARVDFIVDDRTSWFLEVNTMPGFTDHSLLPLAAKEMGMSMQNLCGSLVDLALLRASQT